MAPERQAAADEILPEPRLALVHARRRAAEKRRAFELVGNALLVHRVPGLVQRGEEAVRQEVVAVARGDAHVAAAELGHERMRGLVLPAARVVVAEGANHLFAEGLLRALRKIAGETAAVDFRPLANGLDQRHQPGAQFVEERAHRGHRHAVFGEIDERVVGMLVPGVVRGELPAHFDGLLEHRPHRGEIVGRPRALPRVVGGRHVRAQPFDERGRHARRALVVAPRDPDERRDVGVLALRLGPRLERVQQVADARVRLLVVREAIQQRELAAARFRAAGRHVRGLVPVQHRCGAAQVVDFLQARFERGEFGVAGHCGDLSMQVRVCDPGSVACGDGGREPGTRF